MTKIFDERLARRTLNIACSDCRLISMFKVFKGVNVMTAQPFFEKEPTIFFELLNDPDYIFALKFRDFSVDKVRKAIANYKKNKRKNQGEVETMDDYTSTLVTCCICDEKFDIELAGDYIDKEYYCAKHSDARATQNDELYYEDQRKGLWE